MFKLIFLGPLAAQRIRDDAEAGNPKAKLIDTSIQTYFAAVFDHVLPEECGLCCAHMRVPFELASLCLGLPVPETQQELEATGMVPEGAATVAVMGICEECMSEGKDALAGKVQAMMAQSATKAAVAEMVVEEKSPDDLQTMAVMGHAD